MTTKTLLVEISVSNFCAVFQEDKGNKQCLLFQGANFSCGSREQTRGELRWVSLQTQHCKSAAVASAKCPATLW